MTGTTVVVEGLAKSYRGHRAVRDLSFTAHPGRITGLLGPNGAGKTTTLRMLLGLVQPDAGSATFNGTAYRDLTTAPRTVGAVLDGTGFHPLRSGRAHLRTTAKAVGATRARLDELVELVGLGEAIGRRVGGYSLGMKQRLALADVLLADPEVLILDEPTNGLDPVGMAWLRGLLRAKAAAGATVLVSSHLLAEVEQAVDDVLIIDGGTVVLADSLEALRARESDFNLERLYLEAVHASPAGAWSA
ncbi:ABC transporter ATP-binding protein [Georgenia wangjunii]|uniref:ABC transporter ATP-binding protein n=1 Tax=Georgenia wangjunii TaxID=3117730 RepID=UPI002F269AAB